MVLAPYTISGKVYDSTNIVVSGVRAYVYNIDKAGYMTGADGITNSSGEFQVEISDQTIVTNSEGYEVGDKLQLHFIKGNQSIIYRHTIASGDGGAWSQDGYLHNSKDLTFKTVDGLARTILGNHVSSVVVSNITTAPLAIRLYDKTNDNPFTVECPANDTKVVDFGNKSKYFEGGVGVLYDDTGNDGTYNNLECDINYGKSPI